MRQSDRRAFSDIKPARDADNTYRGRQPQWLLGFTGSCAKQFFIESSTSSRHCPRCWSCSPEQNPPGEASEGVVGSNFNFAEGWVGSGTGRVESRWYPSTCAQNSIGCEEGECSPGPPPTHKLVKGAVRKTSFYRACYVALGAV